MLTARSYERMTQEELAQKCGIELGMLDDYERGRAMPDEESMKRIADALEVSRMWLMNGEEAPRQGP